MREDFDFVTFDNYAKDTKELTDQAAHIIRCQRKEIDRLKKLIGALVHSAKRIAISNHFMEYDYPVQQEYRPYDDTFVLRALTLSKGGSE